MIRPADAVRLLILGAIWGASFLFIKVALDGYTPVQIVAGRVLVGALTLVALLFILKVPLPRDANTWRLLAFMAIVANILPFILITWGEESITSAMAAILNSTTPLFTAVIAATVGNDERFSTLRSIGVIVGFLGVGVIVGTDTGGSLEGQLAVVLASLLYGIGFNFSRARLSGAARSPLAIPAGQLIVASVVIVPIAVVDAGVVRAPSYGISETLSVLGLGALGTGIAFYIYYRLIQDVGATTASFVTYLIPLFGVTLGWIVLDEQVGWNTLIGALVVIAGIALAEIGARRGPGSARADVEQIADLPERV